MDQPSEMTAPAVRTWDRPAVTVPVFAALALVGSQLPSFTAAANLYILGTGGALIFLGRRTARPLRPPTGGPAVGVPAMGVPAVWWLLPAGLFAVLELVTLARGGRTLSLLADPLLAGEAGRAAGYFGWLTAFWWLVRR